MNTTPASLLERLRHPGGGSDWPRFVRLYTPLLYHWASRARLGGPDAEDLVQDVFVALLQKLPTYDPARGKSFRAWLRAVALNRWRDLCRRRATGPAAQALGAGEPAADPFDDFDEVEYRNHLVRRALQIMQSDFRPTTWKACWEHVAAGRPAAAVAAELGISESSV